MGKSGRIVIPASIRELLNLPDGAQFSLVIREGVIELHDRRREVERVLADFHQRLPRNKRSMVHALAKQRRAEAKEEESNGSA